MYRHLAESIKENNDKQFISQAELNTLKSYENTLRKKEDTYTKQELEDFIKEFDNVVETVQGSHITIEESRNAMIDNIEIFGKTVQNPTDLTDIKSVGNKLSDGRYEIPIVCTGKNMFNGSYQQGYYETGEFISATYPSRSTYPIKVKPNTKYTKTKTNRSSWHFYRADGSYISNIIDNNPTSITTPDEAEYMIVYYHNGNPSANLPIIGNLEEIMIVEGDTLPTTYEPYIEYRTEIILPCELEKIGNISDRLFVNNKGNWCIEKNIKTVTIDETFNIGRNNAQDNGYTERYIIHIPDKDIINIDGLYYPVFSSKIKCVLEANNPNHGITETCTNIFGHNFDKGVHVKRLKTDNSLFTDLESFKTFMYGSILKYVTESPYTTPLPDNQQVKLKSFKGVTHIYFDCEISGEVKCDVNKTKKSIVNSITEEFKNISNELEDIEKMEKGLSTTVKSEKCLFDIEKTNNGYISDICIEGETLVNLSTLSATGAGLTSTPNLWEASYDGSGYFKIGFTHNENLLNGRSIDQNNTPILKGKTYTIVFNVRKNTRTVNTEILPMTWDYASEVVGSPFVEPKAIGIHVYKFKALKDYNFKIGYKSSDPVIDGGYIEFGDIMLLEGDYTDKPLTYFEGLKSVGDGIDEIIVSSINENLFNEYQDVKPGSTSYWNYTEGQFNIDTTANYVSNWYWIRVKPNTKYFIKAELDAWVRIYKNRENQHGDGSTHLTFIREDKPQATFITDNSGWITIRFTNETKIGVSYIRNLIISECDINYIPHQSNKKQLMYYDNTINQWLKPVLRSLPNGVKDTIEKHNDGKYYYHKRCEEIVLNGNEKDISIHGGVSVEGRTTIVIPYVRHYSLVYPTSSVHVYCDKLTPSSRDGLSDKSNVICFHGFNYTDSTTYNAWIGISVDNSKLDSHGLEGVKKWLSINTPTVIIPAITGKIEEVYECTNIDLQTFEDTTTMIIESGPICPKTNVSVVSNIGATLHVVKEKISNLETQMSSNNTFDSIVLLQSLYSSDVASLQFNISVCNESRISNDSTIYDNDIYVLIKDILVNGKDLINLEYLETVIDFYIMVNKISYEIADELFDLLYIDESSIEE